MSTRGTLRIATRGSDLALRQARQVEAALEDRRYEVELVEVETRGDRVRDELIHRLGKTGAFVRSLDERVLEGEVDAAVHSMKDMPTESPPELIVAGIPERGSPGDVLLTPDGSDLDELRADAVVGTSSLRRRAQLLARRPDLSVEPLRGNVDTRIEKLLAPGLQREHETRLDAEENGEGDEYDRTVEEWFSGLAEIERRALERKVETEYDAIVLAAAGLERSGLRERVDGVDLPLSDFVPAPGQGALAVTAADGSDAAEVIHDVLDHPRTRVETTVERVILATLGGGCIAPIGVHAVVQGAHVHATAQVFGAVGEDGENGEDAVRATRDLPVERHAEAAREFAADLRERGAAALIDEAAADEAREGPREETEDEGAGDDRADGEPGAGDGPA